MKQTKFTVEYKGITGSDRSIVVEVNSYKEALNKVFDSKYQISNLQDGVKVTSEKEDKTKEYTKQEVNSIVNKSDNMQFQRLL